MSRVDTILDRFVPKWKRDAETECWIWTAFTDQAGYGRLNVGNIPKLAHRISYELFTGPIRAGLDIDHLCGNRACVNPNHLEAVTHAENMRRTMRETCRRGHAVIPENRYRVRGRNSECRLCKLEHARRYRAARRQKP